ncbi:hypothetical protein C7M84_018011 [Penaeus vannamei]|uniref:Uncharacterized protein n=1 Tax=Penaeus vannamei TaxID=6689 RepID=A0A423SII2_PENVA|nr:hypothetical protein C7M84_018011 [Penaeus vannamei]
MDIISGQDFLRNYGQLISPSFPPSSLHLPLLPSFLPSFLSISSFSLYFSSFLPFLLSISFFLPPSLLFFLPSFPHILPFFLSALPSFLPAPSSLFISTFFLHRFLLPSFLPTLPLFSLSLPLPFFSESSEDFLGLPQLRRTHLSLFSLHISLPLYVSSFLPSLSMVSSFLPSLRFFSFLPFFPPFPSFFLPSFLSSRPLSLFSLSLPHFPSSPRVQKISSFPRNYEEPISPSPSLFYSSSLSPFFFLHSSLLPSPFPPSLPLFPLSSLSPTSFLPDLPPSFLSLSPLPSLLPTPSFLSLPLFPSSPRVQKISSVPRNYEEPEGALAESCSRQEIETDGRSRLRRPPRSQQKTESATLGEPSLVFVEASHWRRNSGILSFSVAHASAAKDG